MERRYRPLDLSSDTRDFKQLFVKIVEQISAEIDTNELVDNILGDICGYFGVGCGFVYETKEDGIFYLKEHYKTYRGYSLHQAIFLPDILDLEESQQLKGGQPLFFSGQQNGESSEPSRLSTYFEANTVLLIPVLNAESRLTALVGLTDRRDEIFSGDDDVRTARTALNLLVNYIRLRIYNRELESTRALMKGIMDNIGFDIYVTDFTTDEILYANPSMAAPHGGVSEMVGKTCWQFLSPGKSGRCECCPKRKAPLLRNDGDTKPYLWDYQRPSDGSWFRVICAVFRWIDGRPVHVVSSVDITENKRYEEIIFRLAYYDETTGLPNRSKLINDMDKTFARSPCEDYDGIYLIFFDLDGFKAVNDALGHQAGDELLMMIGSTLQDNPLFKNHAYRHGGDEFVLFYEGMSRKRIGEIARALLCLFQSPWNLKDGSVLCRASMGIAHCPADGTRAEPLTHAADLIMYKAKQGGKNRAIFSDGEEITLDKAETRTCVSCDSVPSVLPE